MLDSTITNQLRSLFQNLQSTYRFRATVDESREQAAPMREFLNDFAATSGKLSVSFEPGRAGELEFVLDKDEHPTGVKFRGIPNGHEFTSLILAVLNADGQGKNLPDKAIERRIRAIDTPVGLQTYVSLTCTNCPDVVQALNIMALLNTKISHEMIDGALFQDEVNGLAIQGVPAVFANGKPFHSGRAVFSELLEKLEDTFGSSQPDNLPKEELTYDVVVLGGGPAGCSAAVYSARKGLKVALVAERIGGQVKDTVGIENFISVPYTTGAQLVDDLKSHLSKYPVDVFENRKVESVDLKAVQKRVEAKGGEVFLAPAVILATGAGWRRLNVDDESKYIGHGVHFCPHCDGPFYKGKEVAVIGGGNSGVEAAIDLAGICKKVTVLEFADKLGADMVLQTKANNLPHVEICTAAQTTQVIGDGDKVTAIRVKDRVTNEEREIGLDGVFVQIGLTPNSGLFDGQLELTRRGEI